jgi:hypothetical protein
MNPFGPRPWQQQVFVQPPIAINPVLNPVASTCVTSRGVCPLVAPVRPNSPCVCSSVWGPIQGLTR